LKRSRGGLRRTTVLVLGLCLALIISGCDSGSTTPTAMNTPGAAAGPVSVVASFYPIEYLARRIGGEHVEVFNPVPPGAEPHDLELTPRSIERIQKSHVFLYLGEGFQPAVDRALDTIKGPDLVVKDVAEGLRLVPGVDEHEEESGLDPHIWLDPVIAQDIAGNIADALKQANPANADTYTANADKVRAELAALDADFKSGLANCKRKEIITSHAAFAYLAKRYGLEQVPITGLSPEAEPSPARLQEIITFAKAHDAKYIFFETLVEPKVAQLIASEVGAQTLVLNPIEGLTSEQVSAGSDYMSIMRENLANLKTALDCGQENA
jgi:zinc transport system substrate-binding protein